MLSSYIETSNIYFRKSDGMPIITCVEELVQCQEDRCRDVVSGGEHTAYHNLRARVRHLRCHLVDHRQARIVEAYATHHRHIHLP